MKFVIRAAGGRLSTPSAAFACLLVCLLAGWAEHWACRGQTGKSVCCPKAVKYLRARMTLTDAHYTSCSSQAILQSKLKDGMHSRLPVPQLGYTLHV